MELVSLPPNPLFSTSSSSLPSQPLATSDFEIIWGYMETMAFVLFLTTMHLNTQKLFPLQLMSPALTSGFFTTSTPWEALSSVQFSCSVVSNSL